MKKKIVKTMLLGCMILSLSLSTSEISFAEESIEITSKNSNTVIYEDNRTFISLEKCSYTEAASDIILSLTIQNDNPQILEIEFSDIIVDNSKIEMKFGNKDEYKAGEHFYSARYIALEDLEAINATKFDKLSFTVSGTFKDGTELFRDNVVIDKDSFISLFDEEDTSEEINTQNVESDSEATTTNTSDTDITSEDTELKSENETLKEKNSSLESENTELKEKVSSLEAENEDLKETNKKLKSSNKKLKKENEELKAAQNETVPEETPSAELEPTEAPQEPVTEYKDATTIRIVQQALNEAGYNCGNPDGVAGSKTSQAITSYQTAKGITVNGLVTDELLQSLGIVEKVQEAVKAEGAKNEYSADYSYDQLARNPDTYIGNKVKIKGKVLQADSSGDTCYARVAMNSSYDTVVFVTYPKDLLGYRLLEDDIVTVYGVSLGVYSYEAVSGATITIPWLNADIIEM